MSGTDDQRDAGHDHHHREAEQPPPHRYHAGPRLLGLRLRRAAGVSCRARLRALIRPIHRLNPGIPAATNTNTAATHHNQW